MLYELFSKVILLITLYDIISLVSQELRALRCHAKGFNIIKVICKVRPIYQPVNVHKISTKSDLVTKP